MSRPDPLKLFLGNLHPTCNKPQLHKLLSNLGLLEYVQEILVPKSSGANGNAGACFMTFADVDVAATALMRLNGLQDPSVAPGRVVVTRTTSMGARKWSPRRHCVMCFVSDVISPLREI